jgi:hypothetical protein
VYHVRGREGKAGGFDARQEEYNKLNFLTVYVYKTRRNFKNFVLLNFLTVYVYKTRQNIKNLVLLYCFKAYADLSAPAKRPGFKGPPVKE